MIDECIEQLENDTVWCLCLPFLYCKRQDAETATTVSSVRHLWATTQSQSSKTKKTSAQQIHGKEN